MIILLLLIRAEAYWELKEKKIAEISYELVLSGFCNQWLTLDNSEWWSYSFMVGSDLIQYHEDRKGFMKTAGDPTPDLITIGHWNSSYCDYNYKFFLTMKQEYQVIRNVVKSLLPITIVQEGLVNDYLFVTESTRVPVVYVSSPNMFIIQRDLGTFSTREAYLLKTPAKVNKTPNKFLICEICNFFEEFEEGNAIHIVTSEEETTKYIVKIWDRNIAEVDSSIKGTLISWDLQPCEEEALHEVSQIANWNPFCPHKLSIGPSRKIKDCFVLPEVASGMILFNFTDYSPAFTINLLGEDRREILEIQFGIEEHVRITDLQTNTRSIKPKLDIVNPFWIIIHENDLFIGTEAFSLSSLKIIHTSYSISSSRFVVIHSLQEFEIEGVYNYKVQTRVKKLLSLINTTPENYFNTHLVSLQEADKCNQHNRSRSAWVEFVCGSYHQMREIDEYDTCRYRVVLTTPILCPNSMVDLLDMPLLALLNKNFDI